MTLSDGFHLPVGTIICFRIDGDDRELPVNPDTQKPFDGSDITVSATNLAIRIPFATIMRPRTEITYPSAMAGTHVPAGTSHRRRSRWR
jgi:hypothetical protein